MAMMLDEIRAELADAQARRKQVLHQMRQATTFAGRSHWQAKVTLVEREIAMLIAAKRIELEKVER